MRKLRCAACAAVLLLVAAGPAGAEDQTKVAGAIPETSTPVATSTGTTDTTAAAVATEPDVDVAAGSIVQEAQTDSFGRTVSTYYCRTLSVARIQRTLFGFVAYKFWQRKRWCWSYPRILSREVSTYITDVDPNYLYKGVVSSWGNWYIWCCGDAYSGHASFREGRFTNCILKFGCIGEHYPWVRINSRGDGSYTYSTGT